VLQGDPISRVTTRTRAATVLALAVACGALAALRSARLGLGLVAAVGIAYAGSGRVAVRRARRLGRSRRAGARYHLRVGGRHRLLVLHRGRERRFLRDAFSRYLAPDVVAALGEPSRVGWRWVARSAS